MLRHTRLGLLAIGWALALQPVQADQCLDCHTEQTPNQVADWKADQVTILQALGVLDPDGNPTARLDAVKAADIARLTQEDFDRERSKMIRACSKCHAERFARGVWRRETR